MFNIDFAERRITPSALALRATVDTPVNPLRTRRSQACLRDLAASFTRGLSVALPSMREGAGKTGCFPHPRSRVPFALGQKLHTSIQVQAEHPGLPCAMALRLASRSSRRTALLPPSPALPNAGLAPAPRRPNHATSPYAPGACVSRA